MSQKNHPANQGGKKDIRGSVKRPADQSAEASERIFLHSPDMLCLAGFDGYFKKLNPSWERTLGYTSEQLLSKPWMEFVHPDDVEATQKAGADILEGKEINQFENRFICKDGTVKWLSWNTFPYPEEGIMFGVARDVTQIKQTRDALTERETFYRALFENANDAIILMKDGMFAEFNHKAEQLFKAGREQIRNRQPEEFSPPFQSDGTPSREKAKKYLDAALTGEPQFFEWTHKASDGTEFDAEVSLSLVDTGQKMIQAIVRDVSQRKKDALALQESRQMLRAVIDTIPIRVFWKDLNMNYMGCNLAFARDAGMKAPEDLIGKNDHDLKWAARADHYRNDDREVIRTKETKVIYQDPHSNPEGKKFWLKTTKAPLKNIQGETIGVLGTYEDITEIKRTGQIQKVLYEISNAVVYSKDLESLIRLIREQLESLISAPNFYIALYDEQTGMLSIPYELDEKDSIETWPARRSATGLVIEQKKTLLLKREDVERLIKNDVIDLVGTISESWLGVPLLDEDKVIGAIALQSYTNPQAFDEHTVHILEFVSSQVSLAIQRKKSLHDIIEARDKAEENNRLKTAFLNNLSHEIRTPLNAIVGFSEFLNEPGLEPERIHHLTDIICRSSNQLLSIIEDIVNISKIEAGLLEAWEKETNVSQVVSNVYDQLQIKAAEKEIKFRYNCGLRAPEAAVLTDGTKLTQVLTNLVDNAIKFTEKGHVEFGCSLKGGFLKFYVADTGPGIAPDMQKLIFERFHQLEIGHAQTKGGMGLGLPISKSFVELMGGEIWLESSPGSGTIFFFTIPWKPLEEISDTAGATESPQNLSAKQTILVAEDEENNFELTKVILSMHDVEILHAWNGRQAVDMCRENQEIDLVLMDIKMPIMNGYEATSEIKKTRPQLPVVALTAYALPGDREKALNAGCDDYMSKPVSLKEFLTIVKKHL
ncbi:MAG: PAS domain S-box protein [Bacteroidales bacterium]